MNKFYCTFDYPRTASPAPTHYDIMPGCSFESTLNEQLDTASIVLNRVLSPLSNLYPFDRVFIYDGSNNLVKLMLVEKFERSLIRVSDEKYYKYDISLVSLTKILETRVCPSLAITPKKSGTKRTILDYIKEYISKYGPKFRRKGTGLLSNRDVFDSLVYINDAALVKFNNIECPEMQWNQPTLREVIHDLMLVADCLEKVIYTENGHIELSYIDLANRGNEISNTIKSNIYQEVDSNEMSSYTTELVSTMKNVTQSSKDGMDDTVSVCEQIGFRNSDDTYLYEPNNLRIETTMPIYEIEKVTACRFIWINEHWKYIECDITDIVKEKREITTLPFLYFETKWVYSAPLSAMTIDALSINSLGKFSNTCLSYERGKSYIDGFANPTHINNWITGGKTVYQIEHLTGSMMAKWCIDSSFARNGFTNETDTASGVQYQKCTMNADTGHVDTQANVDRFSFRVEYKTLASLRAKCGRSFSHKTTRESADNQVNSYTDSYVFGRYEYSKVNRLANDEFSFMGRASSMSDVPQIGQTYNGDVIYDVVVSNGINTLDYTAKATKQFVLQNYFTGVKSKIRSWKIVDGNEALERNEVIKCYAEFSYSAKNETILGETETCFFADKIALSPIEIVANESPTDFIKSTNTTELWFDGSTYSIPTTTILFGRSIVSNWKCYDNYAISMHIPEYDSNGGGWKQWQYSYVDGDGEADGFHANAREKSSIGEWPSYPVTNLHRQNYDTQVNSYRNKSWELPYIGQYLTYSYNNITTEWEGIKDNREILACTSQIEFCSDTTDIIFSEQFLTRQKMVSYAPYFNFKGSQTASQFIEANYTVYDALSLEEPSIMDYDAANKGGYTTIPTPTAANQAVPVAGGIALSYGSEGSFSFYRTETIGATYSARVFNTLLSDEQSKNYVFRKDNNHYIRKDGKFHKVKGHNLSLCGIADDGSVIQSHLCGETMKLPGGAFYLTSSWTITPSIQQLHGYSLSFEISFTDLPVAERGRTYKQFCIVDDDDNVLIAWKGYTGNAPKTIYLNQVLDRDDKVYDANGINVVGHI